MGVYTRLCQRSMSFCVSDEGARESVLCRGRLALSLSSAALSIYIRRRAHVGPCQCGSLYARGYRKEKERKGGRETEEKFVGAVWID